MGDDRDAKQLLDDAMLEEDKARLLALLLQDEALADTAMQLLLPRPDADVAPLSFSQQRLWFLDQFEPDSPQYIIPGAIRLAGELNVAALERGINAVMQRHEMLRTIFVADDGRPMQRVMPYHPITVPVEDLVALPATAREQRVQAIAEAEALTPFDLSRGPLFRVRLLRTGRREHVLLYTQHHIIADGWSLGIFNEELAALYAAFVEDRPAQLPELPVQYADYAIWQRDWLQGPRLEDQLAYWRARLAGAPALLSLPYDHPRPATQSFRGATFAVTLDAELVDRLRAFSRREGATLFMTLLASFQIVLARYSGQSDIAVGTPIANRTHAEIERLIGFFVNTLVMRADLAGHLTACEAVQRVREGALEAYAHQDVPFEYLVEVLQPDRDLSHAPLFQVMFALHNAPMPPLALPGLTLQPFTVQRTTAKFDLTLAIWENERTLYAEFEFSTDLFEAETIARMARHWQAILAGMMAHPDTQISDLPLLAADERRRIVSEWNATQCDIPDDLCLHHLFEQQAQRTPDAIAATFDERSLAYGELNARANHLAWQLHEQGVGPDIPVGLYVERSIEMLVGLLAILKAGGAYVPLDPMYPANRLQFMLADAQATIVLTQAHLTPQLASFSGTVIVLERQTETRADDLRVAVMPENLAYVIYTSGSTGRPKGVAMPHRPLVNLLRWQREQMLDPAPSRVLQFTSLSFDVSCQEIFSTWQTGGALVLVTPETRRDPAELWRVIAASRCERVFMPVVALQQLADAALRHPMPHRLKDIVTAGEQLRISQSIADFCRLTPGMTLHNHYGPSETHVATAQTLTQEQPWPALPPIGRPIANAQIYILDQALQPVPIGVAGEIFVGGVGMARGYLGHPDLTAERFVPDPFAMTAGARLYRTGDLGRYHADGAIEFLGRADQQVKIRGFRVEPGEIESVIAGYPGVHENVVTVHESVPGQKHLVCYLVPQGDLALSALRQFLQERLPDYMLPAQFMTLDALPLTPSGKIDRRRLPAPQAGRFIADVAFVAPRTPAEEMLAAIWHDVLGIEHIGADDNFFRLGGHSLLATQVIARIRNIWHRELPVRALFETPTIAGLAATIDRQGAAITSSDAITPVARGENDAFPLSFGQQRLWFIDQIEPGSALYIIPGVLHLTGKLDIQALERSLNEIVRRHESLRTAIVTIDGQAMQVIVPYQSRPLAIADLTTTAEPERQRHIAALIREEAATPFDLGTGPMLRTRLLELTAEEHLLIITFHHIAADGWSLGVFNRELAALYDAFTRGAPSPLPDLPIQYGDYAVWQRSSAHHAVVAEQLVYWQHQLAGVPDMLDLPTDYPRPAIAQFRGATVRFTLAPQIVAAARALGRSEDATLFMTLLTALQILLARYTGTDDIVVGTPIANRTHAECEKLIGFFVNTLVLRGDLSGEPSVREALRRTREMALHAYAHQDVPFERVVDAVKPERSLSHAPLFQVMFVLQNAPMTALTLPGITLEPRQVEETTAKFDLTLALWEEGDAITAEALYSTELFAPATISRMIGHWQTLLEAMTAHPNQHIAALEMLTKSEQRQLLVEWNAPAQEAASSHLVCVHQRIMRHAATDPGAVAVIAGEHQITYHALVERAQTLARKLCRMGVGPETRVGLCAERSVAMVVGILATLMAGGAYVPLDPDSPTERSAIMLADASALVLLSQRHLAAALPTFAGATLFLDDEIGDADAADAPTRLPDIAPTNAAYVLYTSGSTGTPKGVVIEHRQLAHYVDAVSERADLAGCASYAMVQPLTVDSSVTVLYGALCSGAQLHLIARDVAVDPVALAAYFQRHPIDCLKIAPSHLAALQYGDHPECYLPRQRLIIGGEGSRWEWVQALCAMAPDCAIYNHYGPTETTVGVLTYHVTAGGGGHVTTPLGYPLADTEAYILDRHGQIVPIGVAGELCIGGNGLARGYLHRPDLTAERFVPHPFSAMPGARLYRTGDLARYRADGAILFLGRSDHQIKVHGHRVELEEIAATLNQHPAVRESLVVTRPDTTGEQHIAAYVVGQANVALAEDDIARHLRAKLPAYMLPRAFVMLNALPLTPHGKVDLRGLPAPDFRARSQPDDTTTPRTPIEETLIRIWSDLLQSEGVGIHDNFFDLGGDSILSIQIVARAQQAGLRVTPKQIFQHQTIAELAAVIDIAPQSMAEQSVVIGSIPLTPIQRRFFAMNRPAPHHYNQALLCDVPQAIDATLLARAFVAILTHHDALRMRFTRDDGGEWHQTNGGVASVNADHLLRTVDLAGLPAEQRTSVRATAALAAQTSLDLAHGPLLRAVLFSEEQESRLMVVIHHLVVDSVSWRIVIEDLATAYRQLEMGETIRLPRKTTSFRQWATALQESAHADAVLRERDYWAASGTEPQQSLPVDMPADETENSEGSAANVTMTLDAEQTQALLHDVPGVYHTQINDVLLTALARTIGLWLDAEAILVELEGHGREDLSDDIDVSRTVGWFTTRFPVSLRLPDGEYQPGEALKAIKEQLRDIPRHGIGFGMLRYLVGDDAISSLPQPEISFNYLGQFDQMMGDVASSPFTLLPDSPGPLCDPRGQRSHLLAVDALVTGGQLRLTWTFSERRHRRSTIKALAQRYIAVLQAIIAHCRSAEAGGFTPSDFPLARLDDEKLSRLSALIETLGE